LRASPVVTGIAKDDDGFTVATSHGSFAAATLVVATGGPSIPKMGSSGFGYDVAR
jgi:predicted flavoprotein YhiN